MKLSTFESTLEDFKTEEYPGLQWYGYNNRDVLYHLKSLAVFFQVSSGDMAVNLGLLAP